MEIRVQKEAKGNHGTWKEREVPASQEQPPATLIALSVVPPTNIVDSAASVRVLPEFPPAACSPPSVSQTVLHCRPLSPLPPKLEPVFAFDLRGGGDESKSFAWHAVASWTWNAQDETCGICRMAFDGCCPDCKLPGDDCPLIWGACNHAFHLHCILKWVNSQTSQAHCPMCRREWQFKG
ncbi:uncharacterized protein LOC120084719 [Benincasa hispida]|uniref:uncharacterized protein LOC120084719 n=1 Tax=Benincasa hispida TaxID=102211 RepID=UPI001900015D|nr:uncharacterized protein LOC120084719 [Benincasa hispida]